MDEELRKAVDVTKRLVLEMGTMQTQISKQKEQIQIVSEHVEKKKCKPLLCEHTFLYQYFANLMID